jgi:uncharacterized OB-fold protein
MTSRATSLPVPDLETSPDARPYWEGSAQGRLVLPRCLACGHVIWYPRPFCPRCGSRDVEWFEATGKGFLYSFTTVHRSQGDYVSSVPYVVAYVELTEGPRVLSNVVGWEGALKIGQPVRAVFERDSNGHGILRFEPAVAEAR